MKNFMEQRGADPAKLARVYLGIPVDEFVPLDSDQRKHIRNAIGIDSETIVISTVARMSVEKRPLLAIDAVIQATQRAAADTSVKVKFIMVGHGDMFNTVKAYVKEKKLDDDVIMTGHGTQSLARLVMGISDIFIMPSRNEGISLAVAEAMIMGLPVVSTGGGGMPELIGTDECCGYTITSTTNLAVDTVNYADKIEKLIRDPELRNRIGQNARARTLRLFDAEKNIKEMSHQLEEARKARLLDSRKKSTTECARVEEGEDEDYGGKDKETEKEDSYLWVLPNVHTAINTAIYEGEPFADLHQIQKQIIDPTGWPYRGYILRSTCKEKDPGQAVWSDAVIKGTLCPAVATPLDHSGLLRSALKGQCFQWCIFDIASPDLQGWSFDGSCFTLFGPSHDCARTWAYLKPK